MSTPSASGPPSGTNSKRPSPPVGVPAAKRIKNDDGKPTSGTTTAGGTTSVGGGGGGTGLNTVDPDQLSDALLSAGVDLKEEENLLNSTLQDASTSGAAGGPAQFLTTQQLQYQQHLHQKLQSDFLDRTQLVMKTRDSARAAGVLLQVDKETELHQLLSLACEEWMKGILTDTVNLNRYRRRSRNDVHSEIGRVLRQLAIKDKEAEDRRIAQKTVLGLETSAEDKKIGSEESQYRNANATALMMTGKKKYSWLNGGAGGGGGGGGVGGGGGGLGRSSKHETNIRYREAREEPQLAMRDLLGALEDRRLGVERTLTKGYARMKN